MSYTVNDRIRMSMKLLGMTQKQMSSHTGIPAWRISDIANNKGRVTANELGRIASALQIPLDCLVKQIPLFDKLFDYYNYQVWKK